MNKRIILIFIYIIAAFESHSQTANVKLLNLNGTILLAQSQSPAYQRTKFSYYSSYWLFRNFQAGMLPRLYLQSTLPNLNRTIERITLPDGTDAFVPRSLAVSAIDLSLDQQIPFTGGRLGVTTSLQRIDLFGDNSRTSYQGVPLSLTYSQPVLLYNRLKWERKTAPLRFEEAGKTYIEQQEQIALEVNQLFFEAIAAQASFQIAELNKLNSDTLFKISQGRYNLGKIAENDLLQIELSLLNANNAYTLAQMSYQTATQNLLRYLNLSRTDSLILSVPFEIPVIEVDLATAMIEASKNRAVVLGFQRRRMEAAQEVAAVRGQSGVTFNLSANYGFTQSGAALGDVYRDPRNQQSLLFSFGLPLIDWGQARSQVKQAKAAREMVEINIQQEEMNFEQEIYLQVMQFNMLKNQLVIAAKADTIAQKRYEVTKQRYLIGKISITDLNLAQTEKDQARQSYIQTLRTFWNAHFTLRRITLYDFENKKPIQYTLPKP